MSDTPRTDELIYSSVDLSQSTIAGFAQTLERENAALRGWSKAQLDELHRISEALGTNDGHSSVTHIETLKEENAALREQLKQVEAGYATRNDEVTGLLGMNAELREQLAALREQLAKAKEERK